MDKILVKLIVIENSYPVVAEVGAYQPGCRRICVGLLACWGVLGISLPLAKTGVSGSEQEVCIPLVLVAILLLVPPLVLLQAPLLTPFVTVLLLQLPFPTDEHGSADGECFFVKGRRRDGPGKSVGKVLRSTGIC